MAPSGIHSDSSICDLSQNPGVRPRASRWLPTLAKWSIVVAVGADDYVSMMTPSEMRFSQGWPA
eukprot:609474-Prorocentrum_lima.AAC.1